MSDRVASWLVLALLAERQDFVLGADEQPAVRDRWCCQHRRVEVVGREQFVDRARLDHVDRCLLKIPFLLPLLMLWPTVDTLLAMMSVFVSLLLTLRGCVRSRAALQLEVLTLRHQLQVLERSRPQRLRLTRADRLLWVWVSRAWKEWRAALNLKRHELPAGSLHGFRVPESIAADPYLVFTWREIRNQKPSLIVGHNNSPKMGGKPVGFGNHPDARFRPVAIEDDPADAETINGNIELSRCSALGAHRGLPTAPPASVANAVMIAANAMTIEATSSRRPWVI